MRSQRPRRCGGFSCSTFRPFELNGGPQGRLDVEQRAGAKHRGHHSGGGFRVTLFTGRGPGQMVRGSDRLLSHCLNMYLTLVTVCRHDPVSSRRRKETT
jgi:hypothetical protein